MPRKATGKSKSGKSARAAAKSAPKRSARRNTARPPARSKSKVGGDRNAARKFANQNDIGVAPRNRPRVTQASEEAKNRPAGSHKRDPRQPRAGTTGTREPGVGKRAAGPGSNSGGDIDTDIIGIGEIGGLAQGGAGERDLGRAETTGDRAATSDETDDLE